MNGRERRKSYLEGLNPVQRSAVEHSGGPLLVIAGAGSGKTRVLTHRIIHLIEARGVRPLSILAITFTNKAAQEMKDRVRGMVGPASRDMWISTFHSACARILRRDAGLLGYSRSFSIYDEVDSRRLVTNCLEDLGIDQRLLRPSAAMSAISNAKDEMVDSEEYGTEGQNAWTSAVSEVYRLYQERLRSFDAMDFDDLLLNVVHLFRLHPDVLERYRRRFIHVLVDEYQDTNRAQYELISMLSADHRNLCVVGDDDQGIYSWRGADIRNILEFERDFPDATIVKLGQNYRSTGAILTAASSVVQNNLGRKGKDLWTENPAGKPPVHVLAEDEHGEAEYVVSEVCQLGDQGFRYQDIAIFYRTHAQSRVLEEALIKEGIPYRIFGGTRFYERREVKDVLAYLRLLCNPRDEISLRRIVNVPRRGIGDATLSRLEAHSREYGLSLLDTMREVDEVAALGKAAMKRVRSFTDLIDTLAERAKEISLEELLLEVWDRTGYMAGLESEGTVEALGRIENLRELLTVVSDFRQRYGTDDLEGFLERVSLVNDTDDLDESGGYVALMTLHNAKGLEYPAVFMVGMEEGIFPHIRSMDSEAELEEERRLCYVGMTRSKERLYLLNAAVRSLWGGTGANPVSRFIMEIPPDLLEEREWEGMPSPPPITVSEGERVVHAKWGLGTVREVEETDDDTEVLVDFDSEGNKRLILSYAPLSLAEDQDPGSDHFC